MADKIRSGKIEKVEFILGGSDEDEQAGFIRILVRGYRDAVWLDVPCTNIPLDKDCDIRWKGRRVFICPRGRFSRHSHELERIAGNVYK